MDPETALWQGDCVYEVQPTHMSADFSASTSDNNDDNDDDDDDDDKNNDREG